MSVSSVSTGSPVLDDALCGGLPAGRTVLVTGGPGAGKSTLAMQFLQAGLERGERCLYISTEQTYEELAAAFEPFDFELDHDDLTVTSVHARSGKTLEAEGEQLTFQTFEEGSTLGQGYSAPFEPRYIVEELSSFGPVERVVLDSVSGLSAMGEDVDRYRRAVFDLIRLFNDEFGATALFTAEETQPVEGSTDANGAVAASDAIQFNAHGVLRLWRENVEGDYHRYVEITKMRGVDHDTRLFEVGFVDGGLRTYPRQRTHASEFVPDEYMSTGIDGLDSLLGGGLVRGGTALVQHDGYANPHSLLLSLVVEAVDEGMSCLLVPPVELPPKRFERIIEERVGSMDDLLAEDRLFLVDFPNTWENTRRNVFKPAEMGGDFPSVFERIDDRRGERSLLTLLNVEAQLPVLTNDQLRQVRFWVEENFYRPDDTSVYVFNPATMDSRLAAFYTNGAWQVLRTWVAETGLQYVSLEKSPTGYMGSTRLIEYVDDPPYVHVQRPPRAGTADAKRGGSR